MSVWIVFNFLIFEVSYVVKVHLIFFYSFLYRLEIEDDVEMQADDLQNSSSLDNILQRLQSFEVREKPMGAK